MRIRAHRRLLILPLLVVLLAPITGCKYAKWAAPTFVSGVVFGYILGLEAETVVTEHNCFENGVPVDCSEMPGA